MGNPGNQIEGGSYYEIEGPDDNAELFDSFYPGCGWADGR
jgi:hypothetical protein